MINPVETQPDRQFRTRPLYQSTCVIAEVDVVSEITECFCRSGSYAERERARLCLRAVRNRGRGSKKNRCQRNSNSCRVSHSCLLRWCWHTWQASRTIHGDACRYAKLSNPTRYTIKSLQLDYFSATHLFDIRIASHRRRDWRNTHSTTDTLSRSTRELSAVLRVHRSTSPAFAP